MRSLKTHQPGIRASAIDSSRRGTAIIEFAVCIPVIITLVFGAIETAEFIHLRQDLSICTYEAAKTAAGSSSTNSDVISRFNAITTAKGVNGASITVSPTLSASTASGTEITLSATVPTSGNYALPFSIFNGVTLSTTVVVVRQAI